VTTLVFSLVNSQTQPTQTYRMYPHTPTDCHALQSYDLQSFLPTRWPMLSVVHRTRQTHRRTEHRRSIIITANSCIGLY